MADRYDGVSGHIERHLGRIRDAESPTLHGPNQGYTLAVYEHPEYDMVSVISNGVCFQQVDSMLPEEFVCTLQSDQEEIAAFLVNVICEMVVRSGQGLEFDQAVENTQPLVPDTRIHGVLASPHPYLSTDFDVFHDAYGEPALQIITLVPITFAEAKYVEQFGADAVRKIWEAKETDLLDVYRSSSI
ncbi:Suppressor of fused protein (SUFU) [Streptoalloteichus tenebrarius]|uniref:Suppressor of fused protein (SUFU) n=1 Tax=Streptoalloteichus tenebrarius (strain ATCC 17920 / DSM 40477 / JCM 4838 / CBS 697.72 / NBRC 16177 / NCIMB 11028 / NRRL B-12390 / A12253. 1 / ISP 5477) TaxID=1933 RepID=A0ABT1HV81_STRSD|nr:suppressor of fused domain protein [Streptoalloteichus tenebrarius]MCP2259403.1 Suppressor of fused protein (SUFU) [Streptoalloteichus tenebrarius]BFF02345.1 hypothetical protein GCM10020241_40200 [Streptoalloteichus tenebrarius]